MSRTINYLAAILFAGVVFTASGCAVYPTHHHHHGYGPPPHAPAHGYRAKFHHHDLIYDTHLGVYVVAGLHHHYYHGGYYYKRVHDGWYHSRYSDRDWRRNDVRKLPPGLAKKYHATGKGKGRG